MEFWLPIPYFALARFAKWDEILREPAPAQDMRYTKGMWHYARGMAFAATGKPDDAAIERDSLAAIAAATPPEAMAGLNSAAALLKLAAGVLNGECAVRAGRHEEAIQSFRSAVAEEDSLHYDEPPAWYYPVRQSLGAALLKAGKPADAEAVYRTDLKRYPDNGWSLYGLAEALNARGRVSEGLKVKKRFARAWARADVKLSGSVL
jgi:tetratricopeptide (TPR) repeat protein